MPAADCHPILWNDTRVEVADGRVLIQSPRWRTRLRLGDGRVLVEQLRRGHESLAWTADDKADTGTDEVSIVEHRVGRASPVQAPSLWLTLQAGESTRVELQLFAGVAGMRWRVRRPVMSNDASAAFSEALTGVMAHPLQSDHPAALLQLSMLPRHLTLEQVTLRARTDWQYEPVQVTRFGHLRGEHGLLLRGNVFCVTERLSGESLILMRHGMLPEVCPPPRQGQPDLVVQRNSLQLIDSSMATAAGEEARFSDWFALLVCADAGPARVAAIQGYDKCLRQLEPGAPVRSLSNTWGDRNRDSRINEAFVGGEIGAATRLGVDVVQLDDGWQAGRSANSAEGRGRWSGFWSDDAFWKPHPTRFANGLSPLIRQAAAAGVQIGLWYAPDSSGGFANWRRDADAILALHREHGVRHFKLDAIDLPDRQAEANLNRLFDALIEGSNGAIAVDLDATAGRRPDYLARPDIGPVFVENRYTDATSYYPHVTLRTLWQLAHWIAPSRLRMEWLNPDRNVEKYGDDPLAPVHYGADYLFAITATASPLAWMELQHLSERRCAEARPAIEAWRRYRGELHAGAVTPIGEEPNGRSWTGMLAGDATGPLHLLVFREFNRRDGFELALPQAAGWKVERVAGEGEAMWREDRLTIALAEPRRFGWFRLI
jgi:alpha-galactosidase